MSMRDFSDFMIKYHEQGMKKESILAYRFRVKRICHCGEACLWTESREPTTNTKQKDKTGSGTRMFIPKPVSSDILPSAGVYMHLLNLPQTMTPTEDQG